MFCRFPSYIFVIYSRKNDIFYFYPHHRYVKQTMQSDEEDTALHSCFGALKSAVMGCCYSLCQKDNDPQVNSVNERTHLLEVAEQPQERPAPAASASAPPRKPDEQSALNRILSETATNVIDVGALGPYALEAGAYSERVRLYTARVGGGGGGGGGGAGARAPAAPARLLQDLPAPERAALLTAPPLTHKDKELISSAVRRAAAAVSSLRVQHLEELVVPFRVP